MEQEYDDTADVAQQVTAVMSAPTHSRLQLLNDILLDHELLDGGQPASPGGRGTR